MEKYNALGKPNTEENRARKARARRRAVLQKASRKANRKK